VPSTGAKRRTCTTHDILVGKAIRDYRKATSDLPGTTELLMTYVENGTRFTKQYGDINDRFYSSVESALNELATLLRGEGRGLYPQFTERLASVAQLSRQTGWGFHDYIEGVVRRLEEEMIGLQALRPTRPCSDARPLHGGTTLIQ
jgi:hypothetical protein